MKRLIYITGRKSVSLSISNPRRNNEPELARALVRAKARASRTENPALWPVHSCSWHRMATVYPALRGHDLPQLFRAGRRRSRPDEGTSARRAGRPRCESEYRFESAAQDLVENAKRLRAMQP